MAALSVSNLAFSKSFIFSLCFLYNSPLVTFESSLLIYRNWSIFLLLLNNPRFLLAQQSLNRFNNRLLHELIIDFLLIEWCRGFLPLWAPNFPSKKLTKGLRSLGCIKKISSCARKLDNLAHNMVSKYPETRFLHNCADY